LKRLQSFYRAAAIRYAHLLPKRWPLQRLQFVLGSSRCKSLRRDYGSGHQKEGVDFLAAGFAAYFVEFGYPPSNKRMKKPQEWLEQAKNVVQLAYYLLIIYQVLAANGH
jgi:hypothetical protein